jgi:hypothetical protein
MSQPADSIYAICKQILTTTEGRANAGKEGLCGLTDQGCEALFACARGVYSSMEVVLPHWRKQCLVNDSGCDFQNQSAYSTKKLYPKLVS